MFLQKEHTGLWIVDVQEKLFPKIDRGYEVLEKMCFMIEAAKILNLPIIVTEQYPQGLGPTLKALRARLAPHQIIYPKTTFSGFLDTHVKKAVEKLHVKAWILIGIEAHICVLQTAKDLFSAGWQVVILNDAVSARSLYDYSTALGELRDMRDANVRVSSSETIVYELIRDSKATEFQELLSLVKEHA